MVALGVVAVVPLVVFVESEELAEAFVAAGPAAADSEEPAEVWGVARPAVEAAPGAAWPGSVPVEQGAEHFAEPAVAAAPIAIVEPLVP